MRDLATALRDRGHDTIVLAGGGGVVARQLEERGVPVVRLQHMARPIRPHRDVRALAELTEHLRRIQPDVLSTHSSKAGVLGRIAGRRLEIPTLTTAHGWLFDLPKRRGRDWVVWSIEKSVASLSNRIVTVCDSDRDLAIAAGISGPDRFVTIHNAMPEVDAGLRARPGSEPPHLLMVARFAAQKDHETLFHALSTLLDREWTLDLVGTGPREEDCRELAATLGLAERVRFLGMREDVPELMATCQVYLLISHWEGFPRSILEALRAGLPVIATNVGGVREAVIDDVTGFLVPEADREFLAAKLRQMIEAPSLREAMGVAARQHYERHFTFDRLVEETLALYESLVGTVSGGRG